MTSAKIRKTSAILQKQVVSAARQQWRKDLWTRGGCCCAAGTRGWDLVSNEVGLHAWQTDPS